MFGKTGESRDFDVHVVLVKIMRETMYRYVV